jgi:hypothetical protein
MTTPFHEPPSSRGAETDERPPLNRPFVFLLAAAVALMALSFLSSNVGGRVTYSQRDAAEYQQAAAELHSLTHSHGGDDSPHAELQAARERFERAWSEAESARSRAETMATAFRWLAVLCLAGSVFFYFRPLTA